MVDKVSKQKWMTVRAPSCLRVLIELPISTLIGVLLGHMMFAEAGLDTLYTLIGIWLVAVLFFLCHLSEDKKGVTFRLW